MSNLVALCARALARFVRGARFRGPGSGAGIRTGEAKRTRASRRHERTRARRYPNELTSSGISRTNPRGAGIQTNPSVADAQRRGRQRRDDQFRKSLDFDADVVSVRGINRLVVVHEGGKFGGLRDVGDLS
jgi:hypothetical protein